MKPVVKYYKKKRSIWRSLTHPTLVNLIMKDMFKVKVVGEDKKHKNLATIKDEQWSSYILINAANLEQTL